MIELPVDNKSQTYASAIAFLLLVIAIAFFLYSFSGRLFIIYFLAFIFLVWVGVVIKEVRKNDINKVLLVHEKLLVYHRSGLVEVPIKNIEQVSLSLNYFVDKQGLSNRYTLYLSQKYIFGNKIILKYKFINKLNMTKLNKDPEAINIIKEGMK